MSTETARRLDDALRAKGVSLSPGDLADVSSAILGVQARTADPVWERETRTWVALQAIDYGKAIPDDALLDKAFAEAYRADGGRVDRDDVLFRAMCLLDSQARRAA